jgi:hypothetical protein
MAVQITPTATQHTGMTASPAGSVAAWQVTFQLDAENLLRAAISIPVAGPTTHHEAQQEAIKIWLIVKVVWVILGARSPTKLCIV